MSSAPDECFLRLDSMLAFPVLLHDSDTQGLQYSYSVILKAILGRVAAVLSVHAIRVDLEYACVDK